MNDREGRRRVVRGARKRRGSVGPVTRDDDDTNMFTWLVQLVYVQRRMVLTVLLVGFVLGSLQAVPILQSMYLGGQVVGSTQERYEEIVLTKDSFAKKYGFSFSDQLQVTEVEKNSPAFHAGIRKFIGRTMRRVNGIRIHDSGDFSRAIARRQRRSSITTPVVVDFVPLLRVGGAVRSVQRLVFKSGQVVPQGTLGIILRVPGLTKGSVAQVRFGGVRFDANPYQVEPVVEEDSVPRRFEVVPAWILKNRGKEDVEAIINELGYGPLGYLPKLMEYGLDRMDLLAQGTIQDGAALGVLPLHFDRMTDMAAAVVKERKRLEEHRVADELQAKELSHLSELESEAARRVYSELNKHANLVAAANASRLNSTG
ncbi:hypothetical protein DIPPA_34932 [Diplonema papillatum]|nr:hypothetical protein DIPPA_34932 [Diplonema papillatum]